MKYEFISDELIKVCGELKIACSFLEKTEASQYVSRVIQKYNPRKTSGHLAIGGKSISISLEKYEFSYCKYLSNEPVYVFFDLENNDEVKVVILNDGQQLCLVMKESFGMEYFVSNERVDYLLAVNWYAIEGVGTAKSWLRNLV